MAVKRLANYLEFLRKGYYRRRNQVKDFFKKYFKGKCNIKGYCLSYYYVINLNVCKIQCCCKNPFKIF